MHVETSNDIATHIIQKRNDETNSLSMPNTIHFVVGVLCITSMSPIKLIPMCHVCDYMEMCLSDINKMLNLGVTESSTSILIR